MIFKFWAGLALALMAAETFMPGAFLLWFGFAAAAMAFVVLAWPAMPGILQAAVFSVFALISLWVFYKYFRNREPKSDQPLLNRRVDQMIGRTYELHESIHNGVGKIKVNDALWTVRGGDLPSGTRVVVTAADGITLDVRPAT